MPTSVEVSFVDSTTIQLRFELGEVVQGAVTTDVPININVNAGDGYAFEQGTGDLVGRVRGKDGQFFVPYDSYTPSEIADLFKWQDVGGTRVAAVDDLSRWSVSINGTSVDLSSVSRKANILETATTGWERDFVTLQNVFLELDSPMAEGASIEVTFDDPDFTPITATYEPDATVSEAIHVNLAGYDPDDGAKLAYLSSWNGFEYDAGLERGGQGLPQEFAPGTGFTVINEADGSVALNGQIVLAQGVNDGTNFWQNYASTNVYQMDISALTVEGNYHIIVDGVGRSQSFSIDNSHWEDLFSLTFKGYYHQRSGIELSEEFTDWTRDRAMHPDDGIVVHQTTVKITDTSEAWDGSLPKPFEFWAGNLTGETLTDAWGGWHDAGDFDRRTQHMETSRKLVELHEIHSGWSEGFDGNIPESSDGIPDILNEAIWGTDVFRRLQQEDGGIPGGIESASYGGFGDSSFTDQRDLYVYAADAWSSWEYAATAAKIARALEPYDADEAAAWLASGIAAFDWAEDNIPPLSEYDNGYYPRSRNIASAELYEATGQSAFADIFEATFVYSGGGSVEWFEHQYEAAFLYASSTQSGADADLKALAANVLQDRADWLLSEGTNSGFGFIADPYAPYGWGNTATQPTNSSEILLRVHALTGDDKYLLPVQTDVDYAFGANPMNMSFVTGLDQIVPGARQPEEILDADTDVLGRDPKPGITLYGEYNIYDYGWNFYHSEMWEDTWPNYYDAPIHESWNGLYSFVPVTEFTVMQGMEDMAFTTGYLAALNALGSSGTLPVTISGEGGNDTIYGLEGDEGLYGGVGNDTINGNAGNDTLFGGTGEDLLFGTAGLDVLYGGDQSDTLSGGRDDDWIEGAAGADMVLGGSGNDTLYSGSENDTISAGTGDDTSYGGDGNDLLLGGAGNDTLFGSFGEDLISGGAGDDYLHGQQSSDILFGADNADHLFGGADTDELYGGRQDDYLSGGAGNDTLFGGAGNDKMLGSAGDDFYYGGAGADSFYFATGENSAFGYTENTDKIYLDDVLWTGTLSAAQIIANFATQTSPGIVEFDFGNGNTVQLVNGTGITLGDLADEIFFF